MKFVHAGTAVADMARAQLALLQAEWHVRRRSTGSLMSLTANEPVLVAECVATADGDLAVAGGDHGDLTSAATDEAAPGDAFAVTPARESGREAMRQALAVHRAARYGVFRPRCLTRAIALERMLVRRGLPATVQIGVRREAGALEAHAWVELHGRVLGDHPEHVARFSPLAGFASR